MNLDTLIKQEFSGTAAKEIVFNTDDLEVILTKEIYSPHVLMLVYKENVVIGWSVINLK